MGKMGGPKCLFSRDEGCSHICTFNDSVSSIFSGYRVFVGQSEYSILPFSKKNEIHVSVLFD